MDIVWNVHTFVEASGKDKGVSIAPTDRWEGVKLSEPILNSLRGVKTANITKDNKIFSNIPITWYMVEN